MRLVHHIPLMLFSLILPGVVFNYGLNYVKDVEFILWHFFIGGFFMLFAITHIKRPMTAPLILRNLKNSWFSREAAAFGLYFTGLMFQVICTEFRGGIWYYFLFAIGLAGVLSTTMVYLKLNPSKNWFILIDILCDGIFFGSILGVVMWRTGLVAGIEAESVIFVLTLGFYIKFTKELLLNMVQYIITGNKLCLIIETIMIIFLLLFIGGYKILEIVYAFFIISSILNRLRFYAQIENRSLEKYAAELRDAYMSEEYKHFF